MVFQNQIQQVNKSAVMGI